MKALCLKSFIVVVLVSLGSGAFAKDIISDVTYQLNGQDYEGYMINKGKKNAPLVFIIHDWDGLTDYEKKRAAMLAKRGYSVFAMDLFGKGNRPTAVKDKKHATGALYKDKRKMRALLDAGLKTAKDKGLNVRNSVVMGYCFGGAATLEWARTGVGVKGFATFHAVLPKAGSLKVDGIKGEILVLHGTADSMIPMSDFAALAADLEKARVEHEMITYSGAPHGFTVFGQKGYQKQADQESWKRFLAFTKRLTKG